MRPWLRRARNLLPLLLLLGLALEDRKALACSLVGWTSFQAAAPAVYVDPRLSPERRAEVLRLVEAGKARVAGFYGAFRAAPRIIAGEDLQALAPFGRCTHACTHYSLLGLTVVLGPEGLDEEVVSHELAHAELFERVGLWRMLTGVPTWFDEGLAMLGAVRERVGSVDVQVERVRDIPRSANGKFRGVISKLGRRDGIPKTAD